MSGRVAQPQVDAKEVNAHTRRTCLCFFHLQILQLSNQSLHNNHSQQRLLFAVFLVSALVAINHIGTARADVSSLTSERKINLEDIERDTLINEIRSKSQETLQAEPTEHIPPTAAAGPGSQVQHHVQHHQHGPTGAPPTASGGAVSHQTIVYHQVRKIIIH